MKLRFYLIAVMIVFANIGFAAPTTEEGKGLFKSRCQNCHNINKPFVGPALAGIDERRNMDWIIKFVQSSQALIKSGDADAQEVFAKFNKIPMPDQPDLSAEHIKGIVEYIKSEATAVSAADVAPFRRPGEKHPEYLPTSFSNYGFFIGFSILVILLTASLLFAVKVKEMQRNKNQLWS